MSRSRVRQMLTAMNPSEYVATQRQGGRSRLDSAFVQEWAEQYRDAVSELKRLRLPANLAEAILLLREITYPMAMQEQSSIPSYYPYTCVNILDWYMDDCQGDLEKLKRKSILGIIALLLDLGRFEMHSLVGYEPFQTLQFDPEFALNRIRMLKELYNETVHLSSQIPGSSTHLSGSPRSYNTIGEYANEPGRISALVHFSCMPQTSYHDEVLFLRSIHISELCFYGIRIAVVQTKEAIRQSGFVSAHIFLNQAIAFSEVLRQIFRILRTMPPVHFHDFRASAANASAVQSANYQNMDIHLFGLSEHKIALFTRIPHLQNLLQYYHNGFACLRDVLSTLSPNSNNDAATGILETARQLDSKLLTWRGLHVAFAREYLSDTGIGTGGTSGAAYLKLFLRNTLFGETSMDSEATAELTQAYAANSDTELTHSGLHIAPPRELIAPNKIIVTEPVE